MLLFGFLGIPFLHQQENKQLNQNISQVGSATALEPSGTLPESCPKPPLVAYLGRDPTKSQIAFPLAQSKPTGSDLLASPFLVPKGACFSSREKDEQGVPFAGINLRLQFQRVTTQWFKADLFDLWAFPCWSIVMAPKGDQLVVPGPLGRNKRNGSEATTW